MDDHANDWPRPIPVGERLPENHDRILMYQHNIADELNLWSSGWFEDGQFFADGDSFLRVGSPGDNVPAMHVSHWLPLPPAALTGWRG